MFTVSYRGCVVGFKGFLLLVAEMHFEDHTSWNWQWNDDDMAFLFAIRIVPANRNLETILPIVAKRVWRFTVAVDVVQDQLHCLLMFTRWYDVLWCLWLWMKHSTRGWCTTDENLGIIIRGVKKSTKNFGWDRGSLPFSRNIKNIHPCRTLFTIIHWQFTRVWSTRKQAKNLLVVES